MTGRRLRRARWPARPPGFYRELRAAVRGERMLVLKALLALAVAAGILLAHVYLFS